MRQKHARAWAGTTLFVVLFRFSLFHAPAYAGSNDWPHWRGQHFDGKSTRKGVFGTQGSELKVAWRTNLGTGYSAVAVAQGRAVVMFSDGESDFVAALDAENGQEQWRFRIDSTYPGRDGAKDGPTSTPLIASGQVYALGPRGVLVALDLKSGKLVWRTDLVAEHKAVLPHWGFTTSPLMHGNKLIVASGGTQGNAISAFDRESGQLIWASGSDSIEYQSPLLVELDGRLQLVYGGAEFLHGLDPEKGTELWKYRHGGDGFYKRILNPVLVGEDRLFMTYRGSEGVLLRITPAREGYKVEEMWTSRHLRRNYNVPIYHQGYIYGFSQNFLSCIDADSGQLAWKSRPPGNGFLSLVDDHLIVMTKQGGLYAVAASPQGYRQAASLQLFDKLTWTPASIAGSRIFARNSFGEVAAVDVVAARPQAVPLETSHRLVVPGSEFQDFVERVESAADKDSLIESFMQSQQRFPVLEGDSLAHILYRGSASEVILAGDMFEAFEKVSLNRISGTDFWYASLRLKPGAQLSYHFEKDLEEAIPDPLNPLRVPSPLIYGVEVSQLLMPGRTLPECLQPPPDDRKGRLVRRKFSSSIRENSREIEIYLPLGYEKGEQRYPTLYVHYGDQALAAGQMSNVLDNLVGKSVRPLIAVFIPAATGYEYARSQVDSYARMLVDELIPYIDSNFRTLANAESRAVWGGDEGAYGAFYAAFKHPGSFEKVAGQSILEIGEGGPQLLALIDAAQGIQIEAYLDWGSYDYRNPVNEEIVPDFSRALWQKLHQKGYRVSGGESPSGTGFASWRTRTHLILEAFFGI